MNKVTVRAIGSYHPCDKVGNVFFESRLDTSDQWIRERTGIESRYFAGKDEYTGDLCYHAAMDMKDRYGVDFSDVDMILVATMTADHVVPNVASQLQDRLGVKAAGAIDLTTACSGFCYAMTLAKGLIASGINHKVLVFGAETMSKIIDFTDRNTCILFGDAAGVVLMERSEEENTVFESVCGTDGSMGKELYMSFRSNVANGAEISADGFVHQNGRAVYKWAVTTLAQGLQDLAAKNGLTLDDVTRFIPHSANYRMLESVFEKLGIPMEKCVESICRYGNTSAASVPLAWSEGVRNGTVKKGDTLLLLGFGAGLTYSGICVKNTL